jgi:hypothetical protein
VSARLLLGSLRPRVSKAVGHLRLRLSEGFAVNNQMILSARIEFVTTKTSGESWCATFCFRKLTRRMQNLAWIEKSELESSQQTFNNMPKSWIILLADVALKNGYRGGFVIKDPKVGAKVGFATLRELYLFENAIQKASKQGQNENVVKHWQFLRMYLFPAQLY